MMVAEGVFDDPRPQAIFGLHTLSGLPLGVIGYTPGPALAAVDHFKATITGVQTHGAQPQAGVDPVVMASQAILSLQTIASRNVHPLQPVVVTVGMVHGGQRFNIIPESVAIEGDGPHLRSGRPATWWKRAWPRCWAASRPPAAAPIPSTTTAAPRPPSTDRELTAEMIGTVPGTRRDGEHAGTRPDDGRRGLRLLRERGARLLLPAGRPPRGNQDGAAPLAILPRRQRLGGDRHAGDVEPAGGLPTPQRGVGGCSSDQWRDRYGVVVPPPEFEGPSMQYRFKAARIRTRYYLMDLAKHVLGPLPSVLFLLSFLLFAITIFPTTAQRLADRFANQPEQLTLSGRVYIRSATIEKNPSTPADSTRVEIGGFSTTTDATGSYHLSFWTSQRDNIAVVLRLGRITTVERLNLPSTGNHWTRNWVLTEIE